MKIVVLAEWNRSETHGPKQCLMSVYEDLDLAALAVSNFFVNEEQDMSNGSESNLEGVLVFSHRNPTGGRVSFREPTGSVEQLKRKLKRAAGI